MHAGWWVAANFVHLMYSLGHNRNTNQSFRVDREPSSAASETLRVIASRENTRSRIGAHAQKNIHSVNPKSASNHSNTFSGPHRRLHGFCPIIKMPTFVLLCFMLPYFPLSYACYAPKKAQFPIINTALSSYKNAQLRRMPCQHHGYK